MYFSEFFTLKVLREKEHVQLRFGAQGKRACSVKVWCTKISRILGIVVHTGVNLAV